MKKEVLKYNAGDAYRPNINLENLLNTSRVKTFIKDLKKAFTEQWLDIIYSPEVSNLFSIYQGKIVQPKSKKKKKHVCDHEGECVHKALSDYNYLDDEVLEGEFRDDGVFVASPIEIPESAIVSSVATSLGTILVYSSLRNYNNIEGSFEGFLNFSANQGGQSIIDNIPGIVGDVKFRLSKQTYKEYIRQRVNSTIKQIDKTTRERLRRAIVTGLGKPMSKAQFIDSLRRVGMKMSKARSELIARTEGLQAYEYMKHETARVNGIKKKVWSALGPRTCPFCMELDGAERNINQKFESGLGDVQFAPLHPNCECEVSYFESKVFSDCLCSTGLAESASKKYTPMDREIGASGSCCNPNAVWAGGESLVGSDKEIGNYYQRLSRTKSESSKDNIWGEANANLSPEGVYQLKLKLE